MTRSFTTRTLAATLATLWLATPAAAQSGRGLMHGYVEWEDISYNEVTGGKIHAKIELRALGRYNHSLYTTQTDDRGSYDIAPVAMGEYRLRITYPGYETYETRLYIPSDFECRLAVMLKKAKGKPAPGKGPGP